MTNSNQTAPSDPLLKIHKKIRFCPGGYRVVVQEQLCFNSSPPPMSTARLYRGGTGVRCLWVGYRGQGVMHALDVPWHPYYGKAMDGLKRLGTYPTKYERAVGALKLESVTGDMDIIIARAKRHWEDFYGFDPADPLTSKLCKESLTMYRRLYRDRASLPLVRPRALYFMETDAHDGFSVGTMTVAHPFRRFWSRLVSLVALHLPGSPREYFLKDLRQIYKDSGLPGLFTCIETIRLIAPPNIFEPGGQNRADLPRLIKEALTPLGRSGVLSVLANRRQNPGLPPLIAHIFIGLRKDLARRLWENPWHSLLYSYFARALLRDSSGVPVVRRTERLRQGDGHIKRDLDILRQGGVGLGAARTQPELDSLAQWVLTTKVSDLSVLPPNILFSEPDDIREEERALLDDSRGWGDTTVLDGWARVQSGYHPNPEFKGWGKRPQSSRHTGGNLAETGSTGAVWTNLPRMISKVLRYIEDGGKIYEEHQGRTTPEVRKAQEVRGSLKSMIRAAHWNHNILRGLLDVAFEEEGSTVGSIGTDISKFPASPISEEDALWPHRELTLPDEISKYLVRSKTSLKGLGRVLGHCVGSRVSTTNSLFLRKGTVVAEVSLYKSENSDKPVVAMLTECRDARNGITGASKSFSEEVCTRIIPEIESCPTLRGLSPIEGKKFDPDDLLDDLPDEYTAQQLPSNFLVVSHALMTTSLEGEDLPHYETKYRFLPQGRDRVRSYEIVLPRGIPVETVVVTATEAQWVTVMVSGGIRGCPDLILVPCIGQE